MRRFMIHAISLVIGACASNAAMAGYLCQIASAPQPYVANVSWDGTAPADLPLQFRGDSASVEIRAIGLAGHPEYLFQIRVGEAVLFASSQKKDLKDYNLTWRSENDSQAMINVACRLAPGPN